MVATVFPTMGFAQVSDEAAPDALQSLAPLAAQVGLGGVLGFCAGLAIKKIGKVVAVIIGVVFVLIQVLAYYDVISIDWAIVSGWWDMVRQEDRVAGVENALRTVLLANVPALVGAVPGFLLGFKRG